MATTEQLTALLDELRSSIGECRGTILATRDGLPVAHALHGIDPNRVAAMVSTALGLGVRITETMGIGNLVESGFGGDAGQVFIYGAGRAAVLAVLVGPGASVGMVHMQARSLARRLAESLG
ncbi:MAG TPA: roadblock/LC7 domain-containing protein [Verrucomicrobiae bacterium]|nr:roadblock/LC7 domain-containing protein [Verrucomicrobiae bacterium]